MLLTECNRMTRGNRLRFVPLEAGLETPANQPGPQAQAEIKQLFAQLSVGPITPEVRELTASTISRVRGTAEAREGFAAFLAKRSASAVKP